LDSFLEAYQSADALWYAEVPSYDYHFSTLLDRLLKNTNYVIARSDFRDTAI
jgi:hypothetical protein